MHQFLGLYFIYILSFHYLEWGNEHDGEIKWLHFVDFPSIFILQLQVATILIKVVTILLKL